MCGRYFRRSDKQRIAEAFKIGMPPSFEILPDYNVAPTTFQPVIVEDRDSGRARSSGHVLGADSLLG
jgi:putative SOS response-associated peptidase YedK